MIRGWCPTVHAPMLAGDGLLVRVKPPGGLLPRDKLLALAEAAASFSSGLLELTSHGNLQARGVRDPARFARAMVAAGLADPDPAREARRNVVAVPPCDDALVAQTEALMMDTPGLHPKHTVAVVAGATVPWKGPRELPPLVCDGVLLYLPLQQTCAAQLADLAAASPLVRTTPWRAFLSPVIVPGWDREPSGVSACIGAPGCSSGSVPARADAARLLALGKTGVHVSGCAKGCGDPRAPATLVGCHGRYDLLRGGRAVARGVSLEQAAVAL